MAAWTEHPVHFLDFEGNLRSGILEFGLVTLVNGQVTATATRLCAGKGRILADETAVHGLCDKDVADKAPFSEEWEHFSRLREQGPFAAHFASAENSLIKSVWPYPRSSPDFSRPGELNTDWGPWVDSAALYADFFPSLNSGKLADLIEAMGLRQELDTETAKHCPPDRCHFHAALYDALAGALLLRALMRFPQIADLSLSQLLVLSTRSGRKRDDLQQGLLF